ncbi:MAG: M48 family metallopeptidase [Tahibacter sp.]
MTHWLRWFVGFALLLACLSPVLAAPGARDLPLGLQIPDAARPGPSFDVDKATDAYLGLLSPEQRAQSDAYFEGGYWLQLWGFLYSVCVGLLLLLTGWSVRLRNLARRISQRPGLQTMLYAVFWLLLGSALSFPLSIYVDFLREHQYGLATQSFGPWMGDQLKGLAVSLVILPFVLLALYAAVRRAGERWWIWASGGAFVFILFIGMIAPVFISPLFNDYKPLAEGPVRAAVLSLAHANQIPTDHVEWFDASRQTTRVSANVSGFAGTTRVNLNDNLLNKTSLPEIKAVMGHEMGHYVLNHGLRLTIYIALVLGLGFWSVHRSLDWALRRWGTRLRLEGRTDPAALPLALIALSTFMFLLTPLLNSITRQAEAEADAFGLNAAREPNGFAMAAMRLSTYRKIKPGALEEIIFYDHPSGYARVHGSMLWLKENQDNATANAPLAPAAIDK